MRRCIKSIPSILAILLLILFCENAKAVTQLFPIEPTVALPPKTELLPAYYAGPSFVSGDFNGDGLIDSVVLEGSNVTATAILTLLSNKGGAPTQVTTALAGCNDPLMAVADTNQDQKLDLILTCGANYVQVLLGNGDGTFQGPILSQTPSYPDSFTLADFNRDGLPDLAYVTPTGYAVAINAGGGLFGTFQAYPSPTSEYLIASGDFNGDHKADLVMAGAGSPAPAVYLLGNGDGTFQAPVTIAGTVTQITVNDFNGDGYADLAYFTPTYDSQKNNPAIVVLMGSSSGLASTGLVLPATGASPIFLNAVATTSSGNLDLVLGNNNGASSLAVPSSTFIFLGDGKGGFRGPLSFAGDSVYGIADLNGDGIPDLAGLDPFDDALPFAPGNGDGTFQALPNTPNGQFPQGITVADMNGDGLTDAVLLNQISGIPEVFLGRGDGRFTVVPDSSLPAVGPAFLATADFNGDGKADVVAVQPGVLAPNSEVQTPAAVTMYLGNGDGTLSPMKQVPLANVAGLLKMLTGDFNGDKKPDLVLIYYPYMGTNGNTALFLAGNGDGTFAAPSLIPLVQINIDTTYQAIDLNGDGITDLVAYGATYLGSKSGSFTLQQILGGDGWFADLNGDGKLEFIGVSGSPGGAFNSSSVGDLNGDGLPDIAVWSSGGLNVYLNQGNGSFTADPTLYFAGTSNRGYATSFDGYSGSQQVIALARLNAAGTATGAKQNLDALVYTSGGLTSMLNLGNPTPTPVPDVSVSFAEGVTSINTGGSLTIHATLDVTGAVAPTGSVMFYAGSSKIGTGTVTDGAASATVNLTGSGVVLIRAVYSGDTTYASAAGFATLTVNAPVATTTTLTASATSVNEQQQVTLTAVVQGNAPTGAVTFLNGTTFLTSLPLSNGSASFTASFMMAGDVSLTASYPGDANNLASVSAPIKISVVAPSFAVSASPASATVTPGQSATITLTVTPAGGFNSAVSFSCGTLPSEAKCTFSSPSVTPTNGQPAQVKLTIATAAPSASQQATLPISSRGVPWMPGAAVLSAAGLLGFWRKRRNHAWLCVLCVGSLAGGLSLCLTACGGGGGSHTSPGNPGTPAGTSSVTITASAAGGVSSQNASVQLTVQ